MADVRKHIVARRPCGCKSIIQTIEDSSRGYVADAATMVDFWKSVAKRPGCTVEQFADESWKPIPWKCAACCPPGLFDGEKT